jgi:hypothetical protein
MPCLTHTFKTARAKKTLGFAIKTGNRPGAYLLKRWTAFTRFLEDGRICVVEQRGRKGAARHRLGQEVVVVCRFRPRQRAAAMYSLIVTAKMNDVDPQAWLAPTAVLQLV